MDYSFITSRLATGAAIGLPSDVDQLVAAGITHVIDCRNDFDDQPLLASKVGMAYLWNGTADDGQPKPTEWFRKSLEFALAGLASPKHKVYAHCSAGINRGPSTAYAILLALGIDATMARNLIWLRRPVTIVGIAYANDAVKAVTELGYI